jgi:hypothetical protein
VDLCRPSQRRYETAVAVALGKHMDAIVVDRESTAIECIQASGLAVPYHINSFRSICARNVLVKQLFFL